MATATITLDDHNGEIACRLTFASDSGGFDPASHAHQHAQILIKMMDQLCDPKGALPETVVEKPKAPGLVLLDRP